MRQSQKGLVIGPSPFLPTLLTGSLLTKHDQVSIDVHFTVFHFPFPPMESLQRDINIVSTDPDRNRRATAIRRLQEAALFGLAAADVSTVLKTCLKALEDKAEKCRDAAVKAIAEWIPRVSVDLLDWILPALVSRVGHPPVEDSEEIRLELLELSGAVLATFKHDVGPRGYMDYFKSILEASTRDTFPDIKRAACRIIISFCEAEPKRVRPLTMPLAKAVKNWCLPHKHSVVRADAVRAFSCLVNHGSAEMLSDSREEQDNRTTVQALYILANDHNDAVRIATIEAIDCFMLVIQERMDHTRRLMPLLLGLLTDPHDEVRLKANSVMLVLGKMYLADHEDNRIDLTQRRVSLKDIEWYADDKYPDMMLTTRPMCNFSNLSNRPTLGARFAVAEVVSHFLEKTLADVTAIDWSIPFSNVSKRVVALRVLMTTIYYCENQIVQHTQVIMNALYKALRDPEKQMQNEAAVCIELLGKFIKPEHYLPFIISAAPAASEQDGDEETVEVLKSGHKTITKVATSATNSNTTSTTLFSTAASVTKVSILIAFRFLLLGSKDAITSSQAVDIVKALTDPQLADLDASPLLHALLDAVETTATILAQRNLIASPAHPLPDAVITNPKQKTLDSMLLYSVLSLHACEDEAVVQHARETLRSLSVIVTGSPTSLCGWHMARLCRAHIADMPPQALEALLEHGSTTHGELLCQMFTTRLSQVNYLVKCTDEVLLFTLLRNILAKDARQLTSCDATFSCEQLEMILRSVVLHHGKFTPGPAAMVFRKFSVHCLGLFLQPRIRQILHDALRADGAGLADKISSMWLQCADSDDGEMRLTCVTMAANVACLPLSAGTASDFWNHLLQLLDDASDALRFQTATAMLAILTGSMDICPALVVDVHSKLAPTVKRLLVHLDDHIEQLGIKRALTDILKRLCGLNESLVKEFVQSVRGKHHTPQYCDEILEFDPR